MLFVEEEELVTQLQELGYRVTKVSLSKDRAITSLPQLLAFFYFVRDKYRGTSTYPPSQDAAEDRKSLSCLLEARMKSGISRKVAFQECTIIIEALFRYESVFKFRSPIMGAAILKSNTLVNRLCQILNGEDSEGSAQDDVEAQATWNQYYNNQNTDKDFLKIQEERKSMLEKLHGKEK